MLGAGVRDGREVRRQSVTRLVIAIVSALFTVAHFVSIMNNYWPQGTIMNCNLVSCPAHALLFQLFCGFSYSAELSSGFCIMWP